MLTVAEAFDAILTSVVRGPQSVVPLSDALGCVLAEAIVSATDSPPFDKSLMDGYAVRRADLQSGLVELTVVEEVTAGKVPGREVGLGEATRIMTGAPVPSGADVVVPVEECATLSANGGDRVRITLSTIPESGQFILRRGAAVRQGTTVLASGRTIRAQEIAALAEMGYGHVRVIRRPDVAILATGDELVRADEQPGPGQIRNSNEPMLSAQISQMGGVPLPLGIARDDREHLRAKISSGLQADFLLLSGGVSAGKLDLVPSELAAAGVRQVFHKIQMRPGKPLWFGVLDRADGSQCFVFGLPGNPVSSLVCCELFVAAALRRWSGLEPACQPPLMARLTAAITMHSSRPTYHPAHLEMGATGPCVTVVDWIGSSDVCATVEANCTVLLPAGDHQWSAGDLLEVFRWS